MSKKDVFLLAFISSLVIGARASSLLLPKTCLSIEEKYKKLKMDSSSMSPHTSECDLKTDELTKSFQKASLINQIMDVNLNTDFSETSNMKNIDEKSKYKEIRKWKKIKKEMKSTVIKEDSFILKVLSFNILAQNLLETHEYLYTNHDKRFLTWQKRKPLIVNEILEANPNIICLQEMQEDHLHEFLENFKTRNYSYLYKKRTNDKKDGLLLMYREDIFKLLEFSKVELFQTEIELLSRDNVGIVAKFSLKESPETKFVIATTHLLFNPRRNDVRLGQVQILLAEVERIAFVKNSPLGPEYLPVVLSGDFNLEPYSGVYKFLVEGSIEYAGKGKNLEPCDYKIKCLSKSLVPPSLHVTDECQHFNILAHRLLGKPGGKIMLRNTESQENLDSKNDTKNNENVPKQSLFDLHTTDYQKVEVTKGHFVTFSSGLLTHPFQFRSVYNHKHNNGKSEATTFQNRWVTVDFIFYSKIEPIENYCLPSVDDCISYFPTIPNSIVGSDHFCLGSTFRLVKKR